MAETAPPSYEEALKDIEKLKANPPSPKEAAAAQKAMAEKAASPETRTTLMNEIRKLADAAISIDVSFEKVRLDLLRVDAHDYKNKDGSPVKKLAPGWVALQKEYNKIFLDSRTTATDTVAYINDFVDFIVPMLDKSESVVSFKDKLAEIQTFVKRKRIGTIDISDTKNLAEDHSQAFKNLSIKVSEYAKNFDNFAEDQRVAWTEEIKQLKDKLTELEKQIKEQEDAIFKAGISMGATAFGVGANAIGALVAMGPAGPVAAIGIVIAGLVALATELGVLISYLRKRNEARDQYNATEKKLKQVTADLEELLRVRTILDSCKVEVNNIVARIDQFAIVWGLIAGDAEIILNDMKDLQSVPTDKEFKDRVSLMKASYESLGQALTYYAKVTEPPQKD